DAWQPAPAGRLFVHIVNSAMYQQITGRPAPASPIDARTYTDHGFPWFELYHEKLGDVAPSDILTGVKSVSEKDVEHGFTGQQDATPAPTPHRREKTIAHQPTTCPRP